MNYLAIDFHKNYSMAIIVSQSREVLEKKLYN